jgi:eukaryotic-like serine/threonine-protein kinase
MKGETIGGRYELEQLCGTGGMSSVWRAHDRLLERKVAVKVLHERYGEDEEYLERFRREARAVARLSHPNIVTVIDRGEDEGRQFIVFEFVDGENLKQLVERRGPLPVGEAARIGLEVARGLAFAHEQGLVHRDVKPQNVLLNGDGRAKVTDFGIARSLDVERGVTQTGAVLGTSNYIAPEQASGERVDEQSDVYSLGCVLFELLTGHVPFSGDNFVAVAMKHLHEAAPSVLERRPDTPAALAGAIEGALAKDPGDRITMDELVRELEAAFDPTQATVMRGRAVRRRPRRLIPWPLMLAVLGALLVAAAIAAALVATGGEEQAAAGEPVRLTAVGTRDPEGGEHDDEVVFAVDRDASTYWTTESYRFGGGSLGKPGVGIVLATPGPRELASITVSTDTPGFRAEIQVNGRRVSPSRVVNASRTFRIVEGTRAAEWTIWITNLGDNSRAHVNEVRAVSAK